MEDSLHEDEGRTARTKVLLANEHHLFRRGLKEILSSAGEDIEVLGEAQDDEEAVELAGEMEPDVVVIDSKEPFAGKRGAVERMLEASPASEVVVITGHGGFTSSHRQLLSQGMTAYLDADASPEDLVAAVRTAGGSSAAGNVFLSTPYAAVMERNETAKYGISQRELAVLRLAAQGLTNHQIADTLHVAEATIKRHLANLYPKLGVGSRSGATRKALVEGLLDVRDLGQNTRDRGESDEVDASHWRGAQEFQ